MNKSFTNDIETTRTDLILQKIQAMSEKDFTKSVLIPLFKTLGYESIDYFGGSYEGGKDLICWKRDDFGERELVVIQVKKTRAAAAASSRYSFSEIVNQLQQATEKVVPNLSGIEQKPNFVFFITPYEIDTRALQTRFEGYATLRNRGVKILDGLKIVEQILTRLPNLADQLAGSDFVIQECFSSNISNADLLSALNYAKDKNISDFYCDLDFGVGKVTTKFFFDLSFNPKRLNCGIDRHIWPSFRANIITQEAIFGDSCIAPSLKEVDETFDARFSLWDGKQNQNLIKKIAVDLKAIKESFGEFFRACRELTDEILSLIDGVELSMEDQESKGKKKTSPNLVEKYTSLRERCEAFSFSMQNFSTDAHLIEISSMNKLESEISSIRNKMIEVSDISDEANISNLIRIKSLIQSLDYINKKVLIVIKGIPNRINEPRYEFQIDGIKLANLIKKEKTWLSLEIVKLGARQSSKREIQKFFNRCQQLFSGIGDMLAEKIFVDACGIDSSQKYANMSEAERINMPIREVFESGINCAVFGEAGAGKSTTLKMYAEKSSENNGEDTLTLFLPLTRIIGGIEYSEEEDKRGPLEKLEHGLAEFVRAKGKNISTSDLVEFLKGKKRVVFIFDGIDEVIKKASWIIEAISSIESNYGNSQIILSSRVSGKYIEEIKYISLTLLPFSDKQIVEFIHGWFKNDTETPVVIENHLKNNPAIAEIVRSPLLATILCVLAENKVPLPNGELNLYEERLNLLFGHYDIHKKTKRIESHHSLLEKVARKLAFFLHSQNIRSASPEKLTSAAFTALGGEIPKLQIEKAVSELIDPCNVLSPVTTDGEFGFGHLRYQEHLAAMELRANRGIDLIRFLDSTWWRPVVVLFARMTDDIEHIISDVLEKQTRLDSAVDTLMAILSTRTAKEQAELGALIKRNMQVDQLDKDLADYDESEFDENDSHDRWAHALNGPVHISRKY